MSFRGYACVLVGLASCLAAAGQATAGARLAGRWQSVTYHGVSLRVPASWPVIRFAADPTACPRLDVHAVYLGTPGPDPICPAGLVGKSEAVMVGPLRRGGRAASGALTPMQAISDAGVSRIITTALPQAGLQVAVSYQTDRALALAIASSIRVSADARPAPPTSARATGAAWRAGTASAGLQRPSHGRLTGPGVFIGRGFDSCAAPSAQAMTQWLASSYRAVGIYIGGVNRACAQVNLTPSWLTGIVSQGWRYFPIYPGLQSRCVQASGDATMSASQAAAQGTAAAADAAAQAASLRIGQRTPLIYDMEAYGPACDPQVLRFLSAWDSELHKLGSVAGVYESFTNIGALVGAAGSITEPDVIYYADWDGVATTTSSYMPASMWTPHARLHQYQGGHFETYGGVTIDIDSDQLDVGLGGSSTPADHSGFRVSVAINSNGTAEWFARTASDALAHSWQQPVGSLTWSPMHAVGRSPTTFASNPSAVAQADGALTVFARDGTGLVRHAWQQAGFPNDWEWGKPLPALPAPALPGTDPAAVLLPRRDVAVYQTTVGGAVMVTAQRRPNDNAHWIAWGNIGGSCASSPVPVVDGAGKVDVFCVTNGGAVAMERWNGSSWGGWSTLAGSPADLTGVPAVVVNGSGQTELFAAAAAGKLDYAWQAGVTGTWTWGSPLAGADAPIAGSPSAATWPAGRVVVYARLASGPVGCVSQLGTTASAGWAGWSPIGGAARNGALGSPVGWLNSSGAAGAAVLDGALNLAVSSDAGAGWSGWTEVGSGF